MKDYGIMLTDARDGFQRRVGIRMGIIGDDEVIGVIIFSQVETVDLKC